MILEQVQLSLTIHCANRAHHFIQGRGDPNAHTGRDQRGSEEEDAAVGEDSDDGRTGSQHRSSTRCPTRCGRYDRYTVAVWLRVGLCPPLQQGWPMVPGLSGDCERGAGLGVDLDLSLRTLFLYSLTVRGLRELYNQCRVQRFSPEPGSQGCKLGRTREQRGTYVQRRTCE